MSDDIHKQMQAWLEQQKAYWARLAEGGTAAEAPQSWQRLFREYQQSMLKELPEQQARLTSLLTANAGLFNRFGEQVLQALQEPGDDSGLKRAIEQLTTGMQQHAGAALLQQWQLPAQLAALAGTWGCGADTPFENPFAGGFGNLSGGALFGGDPHWQREARKGFRLLLDYQEALQHFIELHDAINRQAGEQMLARLAEDDADVESLGELHRLWVNCYEKIHADTSLSTDFQSAYGRTSNALMHLQKFCQDWRDSYYEALGLASRQGLDSLGERQHRLRKQVRAMSLELEALKAQLKDSVPAGEVQALRAEFEQFRLEVKDRKPAPGRRSTTGKRPR
ncbi:poly(R)-hydroxyalkanoic acid synthase subunit PhaE [Marinobacterium aestuariivivens]|uniref:Poly(3-hydroxyalkanoate) polymerase subunit PhaE n=1 Tax=Marinobacterium aestuariivivens TaxID=1698799 RepID=A0ABW2A7W8_9GAMM